MAEAGQEFSGVDRAAILLLSIGEGNAAEVLKLLEPREIQKLGGAMASLRGLSQPQIDAVVQQFLEILGQHSALGVDSQSYIRDTLIRALGKDRGGALVSRILSGEEAEGLESLKWMDARAIADLVRNEHPQLIAIVLAYVDPDQAAGVLALLPEKIRADVLIRVATIDRVQPEALHEVNETLSSKAASGGSGHAAAVGGIKTAAAILNKLDGEVESAVVEQMREADEALADRLADMMFSFQDLMSLDEAGTQMLLREVESDKLLIALKGAEEAMREKIFGNMSKRAAEMLREDLEAKGPVRLSEVEEAQKEIILTAHRLAEEGRINFGRGGGDEFV